ncbi:ATP citrate synthase [Candidatus Peregrinibacteria bacterium CG10_big_fil_rev_8_21_14_0_10_49_16]|nr:MAG: ATP citrate synthase [Candidatus Peregrinibacteria bacterium CG22_combo_CG10-13_8_21_14_all_49_11]PIR52174.1 MAG: ATP citrate synthase [Candidatus Peregrinibacteria bacterium CG10_big_fil_rev_8_21_14_0_10_49_16]
MSTLFTDQTTAIVYGRKSVSIQRMLDFDYICGRRPSVAGVVDPNSGVPEKVFYGKDEFLLPVFRSLQDAQEKYNDADVIVNFASLRSAGAVVKEAIERKYRIIATIAEGVPERDVRGWISLCHHDTILIGPATVGALTAGAFRIGDAGGSTEHFIESKLHRKGSVGYVGKSGGMSNEMYRTIAKHADGIVEGVAIGGDRYPGSHLLEHLLRFEHNPDVKFHVVLSEIGGREEEEIAGALKDGRIKKPLVAWVSGTSAAHFPKDVQFGHAGAFAASIAETAEVKNMILKGAGAYVPSSFEELPETIENVYRMLKSKGNITRMAEPIVPNIPTDRRHTHFQCTISSDNGEESTYGDRPIAEYITDGTLLPVLAKLWWKTDLSPRTLKYLEMILCAVADHGPAVAGAHNAIVAASAGKDAIDALCSGLLTIGPRFGGAVDSAARAFYDAQSRGLSPNDFVSEMKEKGERIPGIGHKVKTVHHPDTRVTALLDFVKKQWEDLPLTNYALDVEKITTSKKPNLILNVDGVIAVTLIDVLLPELPEDVREGFFDVGYLNGLFALGRSIGLLGHVFDQKRLKSPLYRHPTEDILYGDGRFLLP